MFYSHNATNHKENVHSNTKVFKRCKISTIARSSNRFSVPNSQIKGQHFKRKKKEIWVKNRVLKQKSQISEIF